MTEKNKVPAGLVWIKGFLIFLIAGDILYLIIKKGFLNDLSLIGSLFGGIFIIISLVVEILIIIGINKRNYNLYKLAIVWFGLSLIEALVNIILRLFNYYSFSYIIGNIPYILVICLVLWYLVKRKEYFAEKDLPFNFDNPLIQKQEKTFKRCIVFAIVLFFAIIILSNMINVYKVIRISNEILGKDVSAALGVCESKNGQDRDYCIYKVVKLRKDDYDFGEGIICEKIVYSKYKDNCYMILYQCNKINNVDIKKLCENFKEILEKIPQNNESSASNLTQKPS